VAIELSNNSEISFLNSAGSGDVAARAWSFVKKKATGNIKSESVDLSPHGIVLECLFLSFFVLGNDAFLGRQ